MSSNADESHFSRESDDEPTIEVPTRLLNSFVRMCFDVLRVLGPGTLRAGHSLLILDDRRWVDWPSLENDLVEWMTAGMQAEEPLPPDRFDYFANGEGHISVHVEHILEDLWSVECLPAIINHSGEWEPDLSQRPASASLTIQDSRLALPYGWYRPMA